MVHRDDWEETLSCEVSLLRWVEPVVAYTCYMYDFENFALQQRIDIVLVCIELIASKRVVDILDPSITAKYALQSNEPSSAKELLCNTRHLYTAIFTL